MPEGQGVAGLNPPLARTDWVNGDKERLIALTLKGMSGPIEVNGIPYNGIMTPYAHLSDADIAAVLSYIRSSFGNQSGPVTAGEVAAVRAGNGS
jgi:mono/diheme cytochrome c family protein